MRAFLLWISLSIWVWIPVWAQSEDSLYREKPQPERQLSETLSRRGYSVNMTLGPVLTQFGALNEELSNNLFGPLQNNLINLGGNTRFWRGDWLWGGDLAVNSGQSRLNTQSSILTINYLMVHGGKVLWRKSDEKQVYASLGLGAGFGTLKVQDLLLTQPQRYRFGGPLMDVGATWQRSFFLLGNKISIGTFAVSLGYLHTFDNSWILRGFDSEGLGVPVSPSGPYLRLSLGMAKWSEQP